MRQADNYYEVIRREYPPVISKEQFRRVAHISKATALYLLQSGKVPCVDNGKKTRQYAIQTEDVIHYLQDREIRPEYYKADCGWYTNRSRSEEMKERAVHRFYIKITSKKERKRLLRHFYISLRKYPDLLSVKEVHEYIGYSGNAIRRWIRDGDLKTLRDGRKYMIPKVYLLEFLCSERALGIRVKSAKQISALKPYLGLCEDDWQIVRN